MPRFASWLFFSPSRPSLRHRTCFTSSFDLGTTVVAGASIWAGEPRFLFAVDPREASTAGPLLLDLGKHPTWYLFLINVFTFPASIAIFFVPNATDTLWVAFLRLLCGAAFAIFVSGTFLLMAVGRLQIRQNGLWTYWGLVHWKHFLDCEWKANTLLFRSSAFGQWFLRGAIPIHPDQVAAVKRILAKRASRSPFIEAKVRSATIGKLGGRRRDIGMKATPRFNPASQVMAEICHDSRAGAVLARFKP